MTGSHYFQVFWTPTGHGNHQVGFPLTWLVAEKHWVPRNDAFIRDPDFAPSPEQWNRICIRCHTTGARPMRDDENKLYDTHVTELGIACEACHGPGESHIAVEQEASTRRDEFARGRIRNPYSRLIWITFVHPKSADFATA